MEKGIPKYQMLKDYLVKQIKDNSLDSGSKIPSENALSEQFQISRHTVRRAISELVNEGWLESNQGKGTFVQDSWKKKKRRSRNIGVITTYLGDYIFPSIIRGINDILSQNGYNIVLGCTDNLFEKEKLCLTNLFNQDIDGLIVETTKSALPNPNLELYQQFRKQKVPVLFMHGSYKKVVSSSIFADDVEAGYIATKHLMELGHRKVGGIFKMDDIQGHMRYEGFLKAHREAGIPFNDGRILWFDTMDIQIKLRADSNDLIEDLLADCTAVVCYNDQVSLKFIDIIRGKGIVVPEHLSMVSFDDSDLAVASEVKLTTVAHPKEKLGMEAATMMLDMIAKPGKCSQVKMKPELVIRSSTGAVSV